MKFTIWLGGGVFFIIFNFDFTFWLVFFVYNNSINDSNPVLQPRRIVFVQ